MRAKLQKHFAYKYKDKQHYKHAIVIQEEAVNEVGWKDSEELELTVKDCRLIVELRNERSSSSEE